MKLITLSIISVILLFTSCSKKNNSTSTNNNPTLSATEQQLIGTWKLQRQTTSIGTTIVWDSTFSPLGTLYSTFKTSLTSGQQGIIAPTNSKDIDDNASLITGNASPAGRSITIGKWYWYISDINNQLYVGLNVFSSYVIDTITLNKLVITNTTSGQITKLWFVK